MGDYWWLLIVGVMAAVTFLVVRRDGSNPWSTRSIRPGTAGLFAVAVLALIFSLLSSGDLSAGLASTSLISFVAACVRFDGEYQT